MRCPAVYVLVMLHLVAACNGDDTAADASSDGPGSATGILSLDGTTASNKLDVGAGSADLTGAADVGGIEGCSKVDFLFVIDSSNSMATNQAELIASFPEFVAGIQSTLEDVESYHVGVVTSDAYEFNEPGCTMMGSLVTQTGGKDSGMETCGPYSAGARYMTEADDLPTAFSCAALVGTDGANDEAMMSGAIEAVSPGLNGAGACNEGFIRDDALLVLVLITDEDDPGTCINGNESCDGSPGNPGTWLDDLLAVKEHSENLVALSLTRGSPGNVCGPEQGTEKDGEQIMEFVGLLGSTGLIGDICADSFGPFFDEAVALVETACGGFINPVG